MTKLLEKTEMQFELPDGLDYIFDNTPVSSEEMQSITEMIQKIKTESTANLTVQDSTKKTKPAPMLTGKVKSFSHRKHQISKKTA
jgi:hypothetical protein